MKLKHYTVIFSIISIILLYFITTLVHPPFIELQKIQEYEGQKITTSGYVIKYYSNRYGNQIIEIEDNEETIKIFNNNGATDIEYGDLIQVTGRVQKYNDEWEIIVEDKKNIKTLQKWENNNHPIWEIAQNPVKYLNQNINVTGYVDLVYDDHFYLKDLKQNIFLMVLYNNSKSLQTGKKICVLGRFLFDEKNLRYILNVSCKKHGVFLYYWR